MFALKDTTKSIGVCGCFVLMALQFGCQASSKSQDNRGPAAAALATTTKCEVSGSTPFCFEYTGLPAGAFSIAQSSCAEEKGTFTANAACARVSNVGGCTQSGNSTPPTRLVAYQYSPSADVNKVQQSCQMQGEQYVQP